MQVGVAVAWNGQDNANVIYTKVFQTFTPSFTRMR